MDTLREEARKVGIGSGKEALWQAYLHRSMGKEDKKRGKFVDE